MTTYFNQGVYHRSFINEQKAETLAAVDHLADDYSLTHKVSFVDKPNQSSTAEQ